MAAKKKSTTKNSKDRFLKKSFEKPKYAREGTCTGNRFVDKAEKKPKYAREGRIRPAIGL